MKVTPPEGGPVVKVGASGIGGARSVPTAEEVPIAGGYFGTGNVEDALAAIAAALTGLAGTETTRYWPMLALTSGPVAATGAHVNDTTDAHDASAISLLDAGGFFTAAEAEAAFQELARKDIGYTAHGSMGATETFDALTGWHSGTLDANCTFTFTGATSGLVASLVSELAQDATGSRLVTWPASVVWAGGVAPTLATAANAVDVLTFFSRDGGTTWFGFATGGGATIDYAEAGDLAAVGETASAGVSTEVPRADHVHTISATAVQNAGRWEVLMTDGIASPPEPVWNENGTDWLVGWVTGP